MSKYGVVVLGSNSPTLQTGTSPSSGASAVGALGFQTNGFVALVWSLDGQSSFSNSIWRGAHQVLSSSAWLSSWWVRC